MLAKEYLIRDVKSQMNSLPKKIITNEYVIIKNKTKKKTDLRPHFL
jgi:hypothetical protein